MVRASIPTSRRLAVAALLLVLTIAPAAAQRAPDGLLDRTDLQRLVEHQQARRAAPLVAALRADDDAVRARAALALASVQDSSATPALLPRLDDTVSAVRADAAFALGQQPGTVPSAPLLEALRRERDSAVRPLLMEALAKQGDAASLRTLAAMDVPPAERPAHALALARYALRDIHDPAAVELLLRRLASDDARTRLDAAYYFGRSRRTEPWAAHADTVRARLDALAPDDPAAMHLVTALGRLADPQDAGRLARVSASATDWRVRTNAARALAASADSAAVQRALLGALDDPSHHVALAAAEALAGATWTRAITDSVARRLQPPTMDPRVQGALLEGLAGQGRTKHALGHLAALTDGSAEHRHALRALAPLPSDDAFPPLRWAARHDDPRLAAAALAVLGDRHRSGRDSLRTRAAFGVFADAVRRADLATVYTAAPLLGDSAFVALGSVDVLIETYAVLAAPDDVEAMTAVLTALGATGAHEAAPTLRRALAHRHPAVRTAAADALTALTGARPDLPAAPPDAAAAPPMDWDALRTLGPRPRLVLETRCGPVTITFDAEQAPLTSQTLLALARRGAYHGVPFHRVVPNFVVQGGDVERGDGFGGPGFAIRSEFTRLPYRRGTAGMASAGKDTEGSQFFVTHSMQPHLDGRYTAFGTVSSDMDAVDCLREDDVVEQATVVPSR